MSQERAVLLSTPMLSLQAVCLHHSAGPTSHIVSCDGALMGQVMAVILSIQMNFLQAAFLHHSAKPRSNNSLLAGFQGSCNTANFVESIDVGTEKPLQSNALDRGWEMRSDRHKKRLAQLLKCQGSPQPSPKSDMNHIRTVWFTQKSGAHRGCGNLASNGKQKSSNLRFRLRMPRGILLIIASEVRKGCSAPSLLV